MFDREKYIDKCLIDLNNTLDSLEELRKEGPDVNKVIDKCFKHYEKDDLVLFRIFGHLCGSSHDLDFFSKLYYFLFSVVFQDNGYYKIVKEEKDMFVDWSNFEDPEKTKDLKRILELFKHEEKKIIERKKLEKEKLELLKIFKIK